MSSPPLDDDTLLQSFSVLLMVYSKVKKAILCKHGLDGYTVTKKRHFSLKYIPPKVKGEMVKKIAEETLPVVKVFVDMRHVDKLVRVSKSKGSGSSEDNSDSGSAGGTPTHTKKADLDNCLAWWQLKLQKAYKNEYDEGMTYIRPLGPIPLTPTMVHDWCLALEDGKATISIPPNIKLFNMANKAPVLHHACKTSTQAAPPPTADLNMLTSAILIHMLAQLDSSLLHPLTTIPSGSITCVPSAPLTPTWWHVVEGGNTPPLPPIPSPSQLSCYLQYASPTWSWYLNR
ncbi:hypothetical protein EDC04DRAFT_2607814 [Pisolithus marmoratus]|nr:hypothetical protein EDC04DRAFT_2607814 [Pisolithus marmoratus]